MTRIATLFLATATLFAAAPATAAVTYTVSGTFRPWDGASFRRLIGGGSFSGSFTLSNNSFPQSGTTSFVRYSIDLRDQNGTVVETLTQSPGQNGGFISSDNAAIYGGTQIYFYELDGGRIQNYLRLVVPVGFGGEGPIAPAGSSMASVGSQESRIANAVIAVPEPATWGLMLVGLGLVGAGLRRRPTTHIRFA